MILALPSKIQAVKDSTISILYKTYIARRNHILVFLSNDKLLSCLVFNASGYERITKVKISSMTDLPLQNEIHQMYEDLIHNALCIKLQEIYTFRIFPESILCVYRSTSKGNRSVWQMSVYYLNP